MKILIRRYKIGEEKILWELFYNTVRKVNIKDYSEDQVKVWANPRYSKKQWEQKMRVMNPFVAEIKGVIVGYSSLDSSGYIDHFFCHHDYQRQGVGRAMGDHILGLAKDQGIKTLTTHASITARPFFVSLGFKVERDQLVLVKGQYLKNYIMKLDLTKED